MKTFKEFTKKEIIGHLLSVAGIVVTVALLMKTEKVEIMYNQYAVPFAGEIKEAVTPEVKEEKSNMQKMHIATSSVASVPVEPAKEVVKEKKELVKEQVKVDTVAQAATTSVSKVETVVEVRENPFEIVRYSVDEVTLQKAGEESYINEVTLKASAYHRQGSLASLQKIEVRYFVEESGEVKESTDIVSKKYDTIVDRSGVNEFRWKAIYGKSEYAKFSMKVKIHAFTNDGGKITTGESEWIEVK